MISPQKMTKNSQKYKQTLQIDIEQSPARDQEDENIFQNQTQSQEDATESQIYDNDQNVSSEAENSEIDEEEPDKSSNSEIDEQESDENQAAISKYQSLEHDGYLILEKNSPASQEIKRYHLIPKESTYQSKIMYSQKDAQVQQIIQDVIYRRRQKQKQKQYLQNILKSEKKNQQIHTSFLRNQTLQNSQSRQKDKSRANNTTKDSNQYNLKQHYSIMTKCKQLETQIKTLTKKKNQIEKEKINQERQKLNQKKQLAQMSKRQVSLEKLKKRLEKALNLNANLAKRVKLQKSKLSSIFVDSNQNSTMSKKNKDSIDQESTIKSANSPGLMKSSERYKVQDTFRSTVTENYISPKIMKSHVGGGSNQSGSYQSSCGVDNFMYQNGSNVSVSKRKVGKDKKEQKECKQCRQCKKPISNTKQRQSLNSMSSNKTQSYKYKSPILQFTSYLIDQPGMVSPNVKKQNIYIQDDMNMAQDKQVTNTMKKIQDKVQQQLQQMIQKFKFLEQKQIQLLERVEQNANRIKQYEYQHYQQVIQSL